MYSDQRNTLIEFYNSLTDIIKKQGIDFYTFGGLSESIREILKRFYKSHKRVAIYCYGKHTQMLMIDFVFEMKDTICIIDRDWKNKNFGGYKLISDDEIEQYNLDGIFISSYAYKEEIKEKLKKEYPHIDVLDLYEELSRQNINIDCEYYYISNPYTHYSDIVYYYNEFKDAKNNKDKVELLRKVLYEYIYIKDFFNASKVADELLLLSKDQCYVKINHMVKEIYSLFLDEINNIGENNVVMLCLDGLRNRDIEEGLLPNLGLYLQNNAYVYTNAYSYSTYTFESLVPAFSENSDQRTNYGDYSEVEDTNCRFIQKAYSQNRNIFFITDGYKYINGKDITYTGYSQTISEKIWDFVIKAKEESNGLFYIHELYESHYSYVNPYTTGTMIADGTSPFFDYTDEKGRRLRTNYEKQHKDALQYLDDILYPVVSRLNCRMLVFADHGNLILKDKAKLEDNRIVDFYVGKDWFRIPYMVISPEYFKGKDERLCTLMDINDTMIALLDKQMYDIGDRDYIKTGRNTLYNPNFEYIYKLRGCEFALNAFECFIFKNRVKLYLSNGKMQLFNADTDEEIIDEQYKMELFEVIKNEVSVL